PSTVLLIRVNPPTGGVTVIVFDWYAMAMTAMSNSTTPVAGVSVMIVLPAVVLSPTLHPKRMIGGVGVGVAVGVGVGGVGVGGGAAHWQIPTHSLACELASSMAWHPARRLASSPESRTAFVNSSTDVLVMNP